MSNSYKLSKRFYIVLIIVTVVITGLIFNKEIINIVNTILEIGKEKRVELFNSDLVTDKKYFLFTEDSAYAVYADKMTIKFSSKIKFNKEKEFEAILKSGNFREIINFYNLNVPEKINSYYLAEKVTDDFESSSINAPIMEANGEKYLDSRVLSEIFISRYYEIDYKNDGEENSISVDILNATEKEKYNTETARKLNKAGYSCLEINYGETLNNSVIISNKATMDELKKFVMTVNEKYIKTADEPPFTTASDIVFIAGAEKESKFTIEIYGEEKEKIFTILNAFDYSELKKSEGKKESDESFIRCSKIDYYTAYKISKITKIEKIVVEEMEENRIEIITN